MPEPTRRHSHPIHVRLTDEEWMLLNEAADAMGLTCVGLLRLMIRNAKFLTLSVPPRQSAEADLRGPASQ